MLFKLKLFELQQQQKKQENCDSFENLRSNDAT